MGLLLVSCAWEFAVQHAILMAFAALYNKQIIDRVACQIPYKSLIDDARYGSRRTLRDLYLLLPGTASASGSLSIVVLVMRRWFSGSCDGHWPSGHLESTAVFACT